MKRLILVLALLIVIQFIAAQTIRTCYEIQYTTDPSGNSPFYGQSVTVQGIVTAPRYYTGSSTTNFGFVISDPQGGPWSGLFIFTNQHQPQLGDLVQVTGNIDEYYGLTELVFPSAFQVISSNNPLPPPTLINTGDLGSAATGEQWESVYVMIQNANVTSTPNNYQEFYVNDGSGSAQIDNQCFTPGHVWSGISVGQTWAEIRGVVDYSFNEYAINPRNNADMIQEYTLASSSIRMQSAPNAVIDEIEKLDITTSRLRPSYGVENYTMTLKFDPTMVKFEGIVIDSTLTLSMPEWSLSTDETTLNIFYDAWNTGDYQGGPMTSPVDDVKLISLLFRPLKYGNAVLMIDEFKYNNTDIVNLTHGSIMVKINKRIAFLDIYTDSSHKNIFNPERETITIKYGCQVPSTGINAKAIVRIYNVQGKLVHTPVNKNISSANGIESFTWNGRDSNMNYLPIGMYYCHLEIIERNTGHREETVQPIVIRSMLK